MTFEAFALLNFAQGKNSQKMPNQIQKLKRWLRSAATFHFESNRQWRQGWQ